MLPKQTEVGGLHDPWLTHQKMLPSGDVYGTRVENSVVSADAQPVDLGGPTEGLRGVHDDLCGFAPWPVRASGHA